MLDAEVRRLRDIHGDFRGIYEDQHTLAVGLGILLEELDNCEVQNILE
jgi:hypothetical protein